MTVKDFYLDERALAGYFEKDWFDHVGPARFVFAPFAPSELYSPYHERLVEFLALELEKNHLRPARMLEVGSSLGRTFYEACRKIKSLKTAALVEPSQNLFDGFQKIFAGGDVARFMTLKGNGDPTEIPMQTQAIKAACAAVKFSCFNLPFQKMTADPERFDLVICSNVIDQCQDHLQLVEYLKKSTAPGGLLLLSCTYQWQDKYIGNAGVPIADIGGLFDSAWKHLGQTNLPFSIRVNERHWMKFLSHACAVQKI